MTAAGILDELREAGSPEKAAHLGRFFKTGPGEYGEGDRFLGVVVPVTRAVAKRHRDTPLSELRILLASPWHEARLCALLILVCRFSARRTPEEEREGIFRFYMDHLDRCNNWDLVDLSCPAIVGGYLADRDREPLYALARSGELWRQRVAIVSTIAFIRRGEYRDTLRLAEGFLSHPHDLIHKAVGWMLREVGKRDRATLTGFLERFAARMPRTALRYAIEHYPEPERRRFLGLRADRDLSSNK